MTRIRTRKHYLTTSKRAAKAAKQRHIKGIKFVDPYSDVHGTMPEKMVYAELSRRGIPFLFLNDREFAIPEIDFLKTFQADFIIDSLKLIIEVQGSYWHSTDAAIESDAFKLSIYEMCGYRALAWWDYDILNDLQNLFTQDPVLSAYNYDPTRTGSTEKAVESRVKQDTSKGIATLNRKTALRYAYKKDAVRLKTRRT